LLSMYSYCCLCIIIVVYVFLLFVHVFLTLSMYPYCSSMYSYCCLCILIVVYVFLDAATLTFPCLILGCKANARVILAKMGHGPHSSKIVVLFYAFFILYCSMYCLCVNVYCYRVTTQLQLTNILYHTISYHIISYHLFFYVLVVGSKHVLVGLWSLMGQLFVRWIITGR